MCRTSHTEDFVKEMYSKINILNPEQLDLSHVARNLGIGIFYWNEGSQALFLKDYPYIFLNKHLSKQQQWQDFCHELAHVLLHGGNQRRMTESFRQYQEAKANHFMFHACVPSFMLTELQIFDFTYESVNLVHELFNVEYNFALNRLIQYINNRQLC